MRSLRTTMAGTALLLALSYPPAVAQLPVIDLANLTQASITSVQTTITAIQAVLMVANQLLELEPMGDIVAAGGIMASMAELAMIIEEAEGLAYDWGSLQGQVAALFGLETAPDTRPGLEARVLEIQQTQYQTRLYTMRTQTLIRTALHTVEHLTSLVQHIGAFVGNKSANQNMTQVQSTISQTLAVTEIQQAAYARSNITDRMAEAVITESLNRIQKKRLEDWPRW